MENWDKTRTEEEKAWLIAIFDLIDKKFIKTIQEGKGNKPYLELKFSVEAIYKAFITWQTAVKEGVEEATITKNELELLMNSEIIFAGKITCNYKNEKNETKEMIREFMFLDKVESAEGHIHKAIIVNNPFQENSTWFVVFEGNDEKFLINSDSKTQH